jgi:hypothetical protein
LRGKHDLPVFLGDREQQKEMPDLMHADPRPAKGNPEFGDRKQRPASGIPCFC